MKKRFFSLALIAILCLSLATPAFAATITPMQASGSVTMSNSGRMISFEGYSTSAQNEDIIRITTILWELRGSVWYEVARSSNEDTSSSFVFTSGSKTVSGGYYYKVTGTHYSQKNGIPYSVTSQTASKWIA